MKKIGLMGGTFDPIHYGHLVLAEQIRTRFNLDKVYFIPVGIPPHKQGKKITSSKHRYFMTLLATITNPYFEISKIEIEDDGISYTVNTIKKFKETVDYNAELYFITGADAIYELESWKNVKELLGLCNFIAASRPGIDEDKLKSKIKDLKEKYNGNIILTSVPALAISSTDIRNRVKKGESIKYITPESVEYYIYKNSLYLEE
ncbi:nicotinate-nucleotide adenylyltransferase [Paramaledivibacter caminithermalis]|jgi:nicotinate-nucleotide adenylyltransferase|uniref:Probable nicotinate-nucleotide adenylyltransferase n=1 Tax=Paramaledivibacter caminithermalis (strain DSM 15212 / CIP 107654 / DViRD3) TaxID=1121301 RepID=A0A1M6MG49_PARC5|nr:nicotinate-nucleotide adenylyltransferase [Paramaledivibacter caminithermalis]SHJ82434.1 nicotinate-nucleotide adenylyltransferase [Paramaledivibacter caminithermalis DSM 15212]